MDSTPLQIRQNPHCHQSMRQGGRYDAELEDKCALSEHRQSKVGLEFSLECNLEDSPSVEYKELKHLESSVVHWGQLKLLLGEIQFLTPYMGVKDLCVVYMGSSPGPHIKVLTELMPATWNWELYDEKPSDVFCRDDISEAIIDKISSVKLEMPTEEPNYHEVDCELQLVPKKFKEHKHKIPDMLKLREISNYKKAKNLESTIEWLKTKGMSKSMIHHQTQKLYELQHTVPIAREHRSNVHVHQRNICLPDTETLRAKYVSRPQTEKDPQLLCISDIRTSPYEVVNEYTITSDMDIQRQIVTALRPYQACLKFRLPYSKAYPENSAYLDGSIMYQPYTPRVSHECRLHTGKGQALASKTLYNRISYASALFHFQTTLRTSLYDTDDPLPNAKDHPHLVSNRVGTDHCFDCTAAKAIIKLYTGGEHVLETLNDIVGRLEKVQHECKADRKASDE